MKQLLQQFTLRASLLVILLLGGIINSWGEEKTITYSFTSGNWAATVNGESANWTNGKSANWLNNAVQITTTNSGANATSPISFTNISKISVSYFQNSKAGAGTIALKVGSGDAKNITLTNPSSNGGTVKTAEVTFNPEETGNVTITVTCTKNSIYIKDLTITYNDGGSTPTTYTVTYDANGGTGSMTDSNSPYNSGATVTVLGNSFTREGYTFDSWNTAADGSGTEYASGATFSISTNTTLYAQWTENTPAGNYNWVLTDISDLIASDVFVIVGNGYAMTNNNGTSSAPAAAAVTIENNKITSTVASTIQWNISGNATEGYTFYPNGSTTTWLYCNTTAASSNNNNMRVGTGDRKLFKPDNSGYFVTNDTYTARYISLYNNSDWRGYVNTSNGAVALDFYKRVDADAPQAPVISANSVNIAYYETSGNIAFTVNNPVTGGVLTAASSESWLTVSRVSDNSVSLTCSANSETTARTATVTLTYTYGNNETVTKNVTVTQTAVPESYTTIPDLFAAATSTETAVYVTFNNWVVSGVNGSQVFVTDGTNGFIVYQNGHGLEVGNTLSGTISCNLVLYNGSAEITGLTSTTEGLTIGTNGIVTPVVTTIDALGAVNTGSVVSFENLTCSVTTSGNSTDYYLSDGTNRIQVYKSLYKFDTLEEGKVYNITGVFVLNNEIKRILPRNAADIQEVVVTSALSWTAGENTELFVFNAADQNNPLSSPANVTAGTDILVSVDAAEGYVLQSLIVDGNDVTSQIDETGAYTFTMPAHDVTITSTAEEYVAPVTATYTLATTITSGKRYVIVSGTDGDVKVMAGQNPNNRGTIDATVNDSELSISDEYEFIIESTNGGYTIYDESTESLGYLYAASSSSNYLRTQSDNNENGIWAIEIDNDGVATIVAQGSNTRNILRYNGSNNPPIFSCYNSSSSVQGAVYLYEKVEEPTPEPISITIGSALYTTYVPSVNVTLPNGLQAFIVTAINDSYISMKEVEGAIPASTPVVIKAEIAGDYDLDIAESATANVSANLLLASDGSTTGNGSTIYALGVGKTGDVQGKVGFYRVKSGVTIPEGKAYLNTTSEGVKEFLAFDFGGIVTGIDNVNISESNTIIFNPAGQRLNKMQKGINIVNGKKVVVK